MSTEPQDSLRCRFPYLLRCFAEWAALPIAGNCEFGVANRTSYRRCYYSVIWVVGKRGEHLVISSSVQTSLHSREFESFTSRNGVLTHIRRFLGEYRQPLRRFRCHVHGFRYLDLRSLREPQTTSWKARRSTRRQNGGGNRSSWSPSPSLPTHHLIYRRTVVFTCRR